MATIWDKIDAFEKHVLHRQLQIARILASHFEANDADDPLSECGFVILHLGLVYFEMIEQFAKGRASKINESKKFFLGGIRRLYDEFVVSDSDVGFIYEMIRNGMYHTAMPKNRCGLSRYPRTAFTNENGVIIINPARLIDDLIAHFRLYCEILRSDSDCMLQENFERMFDYMTSLIVIPDQTTTPTTPSPCDIREWMAE